MTIKQIKEKYSQKIDVAELDILLSYLLKKDKETILTHDELSINPIKKIILKKWIKQRIKGKPIAYITRQKDFFGIDFKVTKNTLIPRPETELLINEVLKYLSKIKTETTILDIGTGSGNIIISLAKNIKNQHTTFLASDISKKALKIAKINAKKHNIKNKIKFYHSNLLDNKRLKNKLKQTKNLIILANLPYVPSSYLLNTNSPYTVGLKYEPKMALDGGKTGTDIYIKLIKQTKKIKEKNPDMKVTSFYEIEKGQKNILDNILKNTKNKTCKKDLSQIDRVYQFTL